MSKIGLIPAMRLRASSCISAFVAASTLLFLCGCGQFFPPNTTTTTTSSTSGDYFYAGSLGNSTVAGLAVGSSSIAAISGSPWTTLSPEALAITPNDKFLYVGTGENLAVDVYDIGTDGVLAAGTPLSGVAPSALAVDSSGSWLVGLDYELGEVYSFAISSTSGALTQTISSGAIPLSGCTPSTDSGLLPSGLVISSGDYVYASCGTAGIYALGLNSSTGALTLIGRVGPSVSGAANSGLAIATTTDGSYLLATETVSNTVRIFKITSTSGALTLSSTVAAGVAPDAILVDATDSYVYVANRTDGTISAYTLSASGVLSAMSGSPFTAGGSGSYPVALAEDNSHTYLAVALYGSGALDTYTIGSTGALTAGTNFTLATPFSLAATH